MLSVKSNGMLGSGGASRLKSWQFSMGLLLFCLHQIPIRKKANLSVKMLSALFLINLAICSQTHAIQTDLPSTKNRELLFRAYLSEIQRLDGDGLIPRKNRRRSWQKITNQLKSELLKAKSKNEIGRVFARLDAAYPNLHAHIALADEFNWRIDGRLSIAANFYPEEVYETELPKRYLIGSAKQEYFINMDADFRPQVGDEVIAINGRSIQKWSDENFEFCKFPLRSQCEVTFWDNFRDELLSWHRKQDLFYTVKRGQKTWQVRVPVFGRQSGGKQEATKEPGCGVDTGQRYPGFENVYSGFHACVYESKYFQDVAILRIRSFNYTKSEGQPIDHIRKETNQFVEKYWNKKAPTLKHLIIDLVDNTGGDMITTWGALFIDEPFQDQWVQFKNINELSDPKFRDDSFYKDIGKVNALESLSPNWKGKDFYPPVPQFCADEKDCLKIKWPTRNKGFKGRYSLLTDPWCISSCVGFAWTLKNALKSRVVFMGIPDSGDSTYARAYIDGGFSRKSPFHEVSVTSRPGGSKAKVKNGFVFRQAVSISRSTDENGEIISALPQRMDRFVGTRWDESPDEWVARLIKVALGFETIKISSKSFEFEFSDKDEADLFKKEINGIESKSIEIRKILAVQSKKKVWVKVSPFQFNPTFKNCARIYGKNEIYVHSLKSLAVSDSKTSGIDAYCFSKKSEDLIHSVLHEYAHSVNLSKLDGEDRPLKWIWEGVAQYLSGEMQSRPFTDSISKRFDQSQVVDFCNASIPDEISYGGGALFIREFAKINADAVSELSTKIKESDVAAYLKDLGVDCKQDLFSLRSGQPLKKVTQ